MVILIVILIVIPVVWPIALGFFPMGIFPIRQVPEMWIDGVVPF
jgi:hypothetical protein